ncbi:MAG: ABC transporter permease [Gemmataceae bacterium]|nr:ABC transporter permease [Gemmataceae bacterium]MCI0743171.1 ABC transporter permease [Gemmataceae bacterium]
MNRWHAFTQLILARIREFYREPEAIFWVYGFPLILAVILGVAFSSSQPEPPIVDVVASEDSRQTDKIIQALQEAKITATVKTEEECKARFNKKRTSLYLVPKDNEIVYIVDPARKESILARHWVEHVLTRAAAPAGAPAAREELVEESGSRYVDFLLPGLIGMNLLGGGLFGVGFVLVDMRVRKLFKRFLATPMHRGDFLLSLLSARLVFLFPEMVVLLLAGYFFFGVPIKGSLLALLLIIIVGAFAFAGLGLLLGCRTEKTEAMSGMMNLVMLPMYLFSGVFFSSQRFPDEIQPLVQALPLTHVNDALRAVMLEGAGILDIWLPLLVLSSWAVVTFVLALRWFRWR